jgi:ubiquitin fusion degradation protein 1
MAEKYYKAYKSYPLSMKTNNIEYVNGGKIILPESSINSLISNQEDDSLLFPIIMHFKLINLNKNIETYCGVLEFSSDEGSCYLPDWLMKNLQLSIEDIVLIQYANLNKGEYVKLQPKTIGFIQIKDVQKLLEQNLKYFATLTQGDIIPIKHNENIYEVLILEIRPNNNNNKAISLLELETDLKVDLVFESNDHKKSFKLNKLLNKQDIDKLKSFFNANNNNNKNGSRDDGKAIIKKNEKRGQPFYGYSIGLIRLTRK